MNQNKFFTFILLLAALFILQAGHLSAQETTSSLAPVVLTDDQGEYPLGLHLEILEDPGGQLTIEDVTAPEMAAQFVPSGEEMPSFGLTDSAYWVRFRVRNEADASLPWRLELTSSVMDEVDLYIPLPNRQTFTVTQTGSSRPFVTRSVPHNHFVFDLPLGSGAEQTIYMRLQSEMGVTIPLTIWSLADFNIQNQRIQLGQGVFVGIMAIMFGYHLLLAFALHDKNFFFLALMVGSALTLILSLSGLIGQYLWPTRVIRYSLIFFISFGLIAIASLLFTSWFLETKKRLPKHYRLLTISAAATGILLILILVVPFRFLVGPLLIISLANGPLMLVTGVKTWWDGYRPARYYLLAWMPPLTAVSLRILVSFNLIPNFSFVNEIQSVAIALLLLLWSLALADRINLLKVDTETANRDLHQSEEKFSKAFRASPDSVIISSLVDGRYLDINESFLTATGYTRDEIIGFTSTDKHVWDNLEDRDRFVQTFQDQGNVRDFETKYRGKSGETGTVLMSSEIIELGGEKCLVTVSRDITKRKQMEDALRQHKDQLEDEVAARTAELLQSNEQLHQEIDERMQTEEALRKLSRAVEQSGSGIIITNLAGDIEFVNPAFTTITGYTADDVMGQNPRLLQSGQTDHSVYEEMWATFRGGNVWQGEVLNKKKNGDFYWQFMTISPVKDQAGNITHYLAIQEDITESKQLEEELRTAKDGAEAANRAKSTFLANMSHELRTPLSAIIGYSEMLQEQSVESSNGQLVGRLKSIDIAAYHLLDIINDILDISRIEAGKVKLYWETFAAQTLIDNVLNTARPLVARNNNRLHLECAPDLGTVTADPAKLRQILLNLLSNAGKFTTDGDVTLRAFRDNAAENGRNEDQVVFQITDTGIGMTPEQIAKVFRPFVQVDSSVTRKYQGTGLGLAISQYFCSMMGGEINVESEAERGSTFTLRLLAQGKKDEPFDENIVS